MAKGVTQYNVKWAGYETKDNTWEPIEHLAGCEDMIVEFKEREKTRIAHRARVFITLKHSSGKSGRC